jgi:hypothetical protein
LAGRALRPSIVKRPVADRRFILILFSPLHLSTSPPHLALPPSSRATNDSASRAPGVLGALEALADGALGRLASASRGEECSLSAVHNALISTSHLAPKTDHVRKWKHNASPLCSLWPLSPLSPLSLCPINGYARALCPNNAAHQSVLRPSLISCLSETATVHSWTRQSHLRPPLMVLLHFVLISAIYGHASSLRTLSSGHYY